MCVCACVRVCVCVCVCVCMAGRVVCKCMLVHDLLIYVFIYVSIRFNYVCVIMYVCRCGF